MLILIYFLERELEKIERSIKHDSIVSAIVSVTEADLEFDNDENKFFSLPIPTLPKKNLQYDDAKKINEKLIFFDELKLGVVSKSYKIGKSSILNFIY